MLVARLRRKVESNPSKPQFILTVPGVGYKFTPHVRHSQPTKAAPLESHGRGETQRAERRQITVLSCQILGFAALAAKLDPEDLDGTIGPVYAACAEVITRFGGAVVRTLGDSMLAYFGYPKVHEHDAPRAVRAALELTRAVHKIDAAQIGNFRTRIGVATGLMLVGELGSMGSRDAGGMGEALNLALHMQKAAPADGVVIAAGTRNLIGRFFQYREIPPVEMEEGSPPVSAWHVIDEIAGMPRFEALRRDGMLDFVGREAEIERLRQCWSKAQRGSGQVVLLTGEAGIGKSRLALELQERLCGEPHAVVRFSGSPYRADAPMSVLIEELQSAADFAESDDAARRVEKLQSQFVAIGGDAAEAAALGCALLGLPFDAPPRLRQLSPQRRKEQTFSVLLARFESMAAQQPVLALIEDAHWIDPSSLEFFALLVERASSMRLLLVIVARPEFIPPWPEYSYLTTLTLPRLNRADATLLIEQAAGERRIPAAVAGGIIARADGVPLFVEELTKSVMEGSSDGHNGGAVGTSTVGISPIPSTLHGLLLARFDRLDRSKVVAQAGAVIGREFSFELLRMIAGFDEPALADALDHLVSSGLVFRRGAPPHATFVFKHALVRDAAYDMLVRERRRQLHAQVAQALEVKFPDIVELQPELLAYHHRAAGNSAHAVSYLAVAAERAFMRSASREASAQLDDALALLSTMQETDDRRRLELRLQVLLARAMMASAGYTAPQTLGALGRARQLCDELDDQDALANVLFGYSLSLWTGGNCKSALQQAEELCGLGERRASRVATAVGNLMCGIISLVTGAIEPARVRLEQALAAEKFALPGKQPFLASDADGRITALSYLHHCLFLLGRPELARQMTQRATQEAPTQLYSLAMALNQICRIYVLERNAVEVAEVAGKLCSLAEDQGYPNFIASALVYHGWALAQAGRETEGIARCSEGIARHRSGGTLAFQPHYFALLSECYERGDNIERALLALDEGLAIVGQSGEDVWRPELCRLRARMLARTGASSAEISDLFCRTMTFAQAQGARLLELRAATSFAEFLAGRHRAAAARRVLEPVLVHFLHRCDCADFSAAQSILHVIGSKVRLVGEGTLAVSAGQSGRH